VSSKSGCESESTEKLLKNTLLIPRLTSGNSSPVSLAGDFGYLFLTSYAGDSEVGGELTCVWESLSQDIASYPQVLLLILNSERIPCYYGD
jgi:hypothetical protein